MIFVLQVVDMTGREAKILTGYGSFATQHANPEDESTGITLLRTLTRLDRSSSSDFSGQKKRPNKI